MLSWGPSQRVPPAHPAAPLPAVILSEAWGLWDLAAAAEAYGVPACRSADGPCEPSFRSPAASAGFQKKRSGLAKGGPAACLQTLSQHWRLPFPGRLVSLTLSSSLGLGRHSARPSPQGPQRTPQFLEQDSQPRASEAAAGAALPGLNQPRTVEVFELSPGGVLGKCA